MSRLYGPSHRDLQDAFDSRRLADAIEAVAAKPELDEMAQQFVASRDMLFLTTIDHQGRPTVSYKGGRAGFVKVLDPRTIVFPSYDGNGMYYSMGNIAGQAEVGLLFIDFERPFRLRLQGRASISQDDPLRASFKDAELVARVALSELWMNCPRYIHRFTKVQTSRYAPREDAETPLCEWKRIDMMGDVLRPHEAARVEKAGQITIEDWMGRVLTGDDKA